MHNVINFKISHGVLHTAVDAGEKSSCVTCLSVHQKKGTVFLIFFCLEVINVTVIFQVLLYFKCAMIFACFVNEASSQT